MSRRRAKRVFILGGGASLGAHQVGALRFLEEQGIRPDAIVGSSIGVVNACVYASGGVELLERAWTGIGSIASAFRPSLRHNPVTGLSLFSAEPLARRLESFMDFEKILASPLELSFILLNLSRGEGQFVSNRHARSVGDLGALVRAGWAIPVLFPPVRHRGEWYVDGGFAWNVPLLQAVEMGATEIYVLAVVAPSLPFQRSFRGLPGYLVRLADVMWRTLANVGFLTTRIDPDGTYRGVPVTVIHPTEELAGFDLRGLLSASPARSRRLISAGYRDAKRELSRRSRSAARAVPTDAAVPEVVPAYRQEVA
ncbi:MAG TPA: patatin-like phospholipase family protein [Myxococcota bacterium]|nr:patatin-like phospholipase family protein [Myxococcota bacterium]